MTRIDSVPVRAPVKIPFGKQFSLRWCARYDGARNVPFIAPMTEPGSVNALTPRIEVLDAEAEDNARAEWRSLHERTRLHRMALSDAAEGLADAVKRIALLAHQSVDIGAATPEGEELRRLTRTREALQRAIAMHEASIEEHATAALLAIEQIYARANLLAAIYWDGLRRHHRYRSALAAEPRALTIPTWVDPQEMTMLRVADPSTPVDLTERKRRAKS